MPAAKTNCLFIFIFFVFLQTNHLSFCQVPTYPIKEWVRKLEAKDAPVLSGISEIFPVLKDSSRAVNLFNELEKKGNSSNPYFTSRLDLAKAVYFNHNTHTPKGLIKELVNESLNAAYEADNDSLVSEICWQFASMMYFSGQTEFASLYCLNAVEIDERIGRKINARQYGLVSDVLYVTRDNEKCIYYAKKAIEEGGNKTSSAKSNVMSQFNTIGLCWKRIGNYDSAFFIWIEPCI